MSNIVFIKGSKQSVVDFINRGLKGCKSKVRIPPDMTGEQIADRLDTYQMARNVRLSPDPSGAFYSG